MRLREIAYKQRNRAQQKVDEWQAAFPHLNVTLDYRSTDGKFRISVHNPKTGTTSYLASSGKI